MLLRSIEFVQAYLPEVEARSPCLLGGRMSDRALDPCQYGILYE